MTTVLVDTSGVLALLVPTDAQHAKARRAFAKLAAAESRLLTTSYTLVECYALIDRRIGRDAVRRFRTDFSPLLEVIWIGADEHERALDIVEAGGASGPSLVDAASFVIARTHHIEHVFAYDAHFTKAGFVLVA
jgi:predicted nucleic acid-binding protein